MRALRISNRAEVDWENELPTMLILNLNSTVKRAATDSTCIRNFLEVEAQGEPITRNWEEFLEARPHYKFEEVEAELKRVYGQLTNARENHRGARRAASGLGASCYLRLRF